MDQKNNQASFDRILEALTELQAGNNIRRIGPLDDQNLRPIIEKINEVAESLKAQAQAKLAYQSDEKSKRAAELLIANKELDYQSFPVGQFIRDNYAYLVFAAGRSRARVPV